MEEWLTEMEMGDKPPPITPIPRNAERLGDEWKDLSNIYELILKKIFKS